MTNQDNKLRDEQLRNKLRDLKIPDKFSAKYLIHAYEDDLVALFQSTLEAERVKAQIDLLVRLRAKADYMERGGLKIDIKATVWNELESLGQFELNDKYEAPTNQTEKVSNSTSLSDRGKNVFVCKKDDIL
jgi:hypothetical protein